jgi:hypothetical protein
VVAVAVVVEGGVIWAVQEVPETLEQTGLQEPQATLALEEL